MPVTICVNSQAKPSIRRVKLRPKSGSQLVVATTASPLAMTG